MGKVAVGPNQRPRADTETRVPVMVSLDAVTQRVASTFRSTLNQSIRKDVAVLESALGRKIAVKP